VNPTPTPTVYTSRSRINRRRLLIVVATVTLILLGFLIGRLANANSRRQAAPPVPVASEAPPSSEPAPSEQSTAPVVRPVIQAESASQLNGVNAENTEDDGGGQDIGFVSRGDSMRFDNVDLGTNTGSINLRYASDAGDEVHGRIQFRLDSPTNTAVAEFPVGNTGGWQDWRTASIGVTGVSGVHVLYITFDASRADDFVNLNWFQFNG
jgi:Carbohydrate binding module (family 6)